MSETTPEPTEPEAAEADDTRSGTGCRALLLKGCLPLILVAGLACLLVVIVMAQTRRELVSELKKRYETAYAASSDRPVLFAEPIDGDAVPVYRALSWCLGSNGRSTPPAEFENHPLIQSLGSGGANGLLGTDLHLLGSRPKTISTPPDSVRVQAGLLARKTGRATRKPASGPKTPPKAKAPKGALTRKTVLKLGQVLPLCDLLRQGVRRRECRWIDSPDPTAIQHSRGLLNYRSTANLMAERALRSSPEEALEDGLATIAFGRDLVRARTLIMSMIGIACESIGFHILEEAIGRTRTRARLEQLLRELDGLAPIDPVPVIEGERLLFGTYMTALVGEPLPGQTREGVMQELASGGPDFILRSETLMTREWAIVDRGMREVVAAAGLPPAAAEARLAELDREHRSSWSLMMRMALPNYSEFLKQFREIEGSRQMLRIIVAARLYQLENGAFPKTPAPLARLLGGAVPVNPVDGKTPFAYGTAGPWLGVQSTLRPSQEFWTCIPGTPRTTYKDLSYPLTAKAGGASGEAGDSDSDGDEAAETK